MLTKKDIQAIRGVIKLELSDFKESLLIEIDGKLANLRKNINVDVGNLLIKGPLKILSEHDKRLEKLEEIKAVSSAS